MIVAAIRALLISSTAVSADVGSRIHPLILPQDGSLPAIVLQEISHHQEYSLDHLSRVQVSSLTESTATEYGYDVVHRIQDNVQAVLLNYRGVSANTQITDITHIGDVEMIEPDFGRFLIHSDYYVYWS
jgi:hypothetical protein